VGEGSEGIAASGCGSEDSEPGSSQANVVGVGPKENRSGTTSPMGKTTGITEG